MIDLALVKTYCSDAIIAEGDFHKMAALVNAGHTRIASKEIGDGALTIALGGAEGTVFMYKLKKIAATVLPDDATFAQIVPVATAQQAVESLSKQGFDVGDPVVRASIDSMVGVLLTQEQADQIKALAPTFQGTYSWEQVRAAVQENI